MIYRIPSEKPYLMGKSLKVIRYLKTNKFTQLYRNVFSKKQNCKSLIYIEKLYMIIY